MTGEKRRDHRQTLRYPARIDLGDGSPMLPCILADISASGAKVTVEGADKLPERFSLLLAAKHGAVRQCKVVWRNSNLVGLQFLKIPVVRPASRPGMSFKEMTRNR